MSIKMVFSYSAPFGVCSASTGIYSFVSFPTPMPTSSTSSLPSTSSTPFSSDSTPPEPDAEPMHVLEQQKPTDDQEAEERRLHILRLQEILRKMVTLPPGSDYWSRGLEPDDFSDMPKLTPNY